MTVRYKGFRITLSRSRLCGVKAWRYDITEAGTPAGYGFHSGRHEDVVRFAKYQVEQRLAGTKEN